jgi:hypothetical protein
MTGGNDDMGSSPDILPLTGYQYINLMGRATGPLPIGAFSEGAFYRNDDQGESFLVSAHEVVKAAIVRFEAKELDDDLLRRYTSAILSVSDEDAHEHLSRSDLWFEGREEDIFREDSGRFIVEGIAALSRSGVDLVLAWEVGSARSGSSPSSTARMPSSSTPFGFGEIQPEVQALAARLISALRGAVEGVTTPWEEDVQIVNVDRILGADRPLFKYIIPHEDDSSVLTGPIVKARNRQGWKGNLYRNQAAANQYLQNQGSNLRVILKNDNTRVPLSVGAGAGKDPMLSPSRYTSLGTKDDIINERIAFFLKVAEECSPSHTVSLNKQATQLIQGSLVLPPFLEEITTLTHARIEQLKQQSSSNETIREFFNAFSRDQSSAITLSKGWTAIIDRKAQPPVVTWRETDALEYAPATLDVLQRVKNQFLSLDSVIQDGEDRYVVGHDIIEKTHWWPAFRGRLGFAYKEPIGLLSITPPAAKQFLNGFKVSGDPVQFHDVPYFRSFCTVIVGKEKLEKARKNEGDLALQHSQANGSKQNNLARQLMRARSEVKRQEAEIAEHFAGYQMFLTGNGRGSLDPPSAQDSTSSKKSEGIARLNPLPSTRGGGGGLFGGIRPVRPDWSASGQGGEANPFENFGL